MSPSTYTGTRPAVPHSYGFARALWRNRSLWWQFTRRNIELRHKGSYLGFIWALLNPLLMLCLYVFVFGYIFDGKFTGSPTESRMDYALALFLGLSLHQLFAEILALSPSLVVANPNFVKKVVFPLEVLPAAAVGSSIFHTLISLSLVLIGVGVLGPGLSLKVLWLPIIVVALIPLALGIAWLLAAVGVFFRDVGQVTGFLSLALMYASAIFFPLHLIPAVAWSFLKFNPLLLSIELARNAVLWDNPVNLVWLGYVAAVSLLVCVFGYTVFRKFAPAFADVL